MSTKAEYLRKYLDAKVKKKKPRKKVKPTSSQPRMHIIDDDINLNSIPQDSVSDEEIGEEAPQVANIIDETLIKTTKTGDTKWKAIAIKTEKMAEETLDSNDPSCSRSSISKLRADDKGRRNDSDSEQDSFHHNSNNDKDQRLTESLPQRRLDSDSDLSPPRTQSSSGQIARSQHKQPQERESDSDLSPPRSRSHPSNLPKRLSASDKEILIKKERRLDSDSDISPPRHRLNVDPSSRNLPKQRKEITGSLQEKRLDSDSDLSPPRHRLNVDPSSRNQPKQRKESNTGSRQERRLDSDSDISPPRHRLNVDPSSRNQPKQRKESNAGHKSSRKHTKPEKNLSEKKNKISEKPKKPTTVIQETEKQYESNNDSSLPRDEHVARNEANSNPSIAGNKDTWLPEMFQPLARYKDDPELDEYLKKQERSGDTMLAYIQSRQKKNNSNNQDVPVYKGPPPPPNRYNIKPGHNWDGVDRSNGFEKRFFDLEAKKKVQADLAYKWSVENM